MRRSSFNQSTRSKAFTRPAQPTDRAPLFETLEGRKMFSATPILIARTPFAKAKALAQQAISQPLAQRTTAPQAVIQAPAAIVALYTPQITLPTQAPAPVNITTPQLPLVNAPMSGK